MVEISSTVQTVIELTERTLGSIIRSIDLERNDGISGFIDQKRRDSLCEISYLLGQGSFVPAFDEMESLARIWRESVLDAGSTFFRPKGYHENRMKAIYLSGVSDALAKFILGGKTADRPEKVAKVRKYIDQRSKRSGRLAGQLEILATEEIESSVRDLAELGGLNLSDSGQKIPETAGSQQ